MQANRTTVTTAVSAAKPQERTEKRIVGFLSQLNRYYRWLYCIPFPCDVGAQKPSIPEKPHDGMSRGTLLLLGKVHGWEACQ